MQITGKFIRPVIMVASIKLINTVLQMPGRATQVRVIKFA
jgi:hypothetical protein